MKTILTNGQLAHELSELIERAGVEIPAEITHQILSIVIQDTCRQISKMREESRTITEELKAEILLELDRINIGVKESLSTTETQVAELLKDVKDIQQLNIKYPSIPLWVSKNKKHAMMLVFGYILMSQFMAIPGIRLFIISTLVKIFGAALGFPSESLDQLLVFLFSQP